MGAVSVQEGARSGEDGGDGRTAVWMHLMPLKTVRVAGFILRRYKTGNNQDILPLFAN